MSPVDQVWVLLCAFLIFMMQAGFMSVEAGITRTKNNISVATKNISDFSLSVLMYWSVGYGFMYGVSAGGLVGTSLFRL